MRSRAAYPGRRDAGAPRAQPGQGRGGADRFRARRKRTATATCCRSMPTASTTSTDIPRFLALARAQPDALIAGCPDLRRIGAAAAPVRALPDPRLGLDQHAVAAHPRFDVRLSRLSAWRRSMALAARRRLGLRMNFDIEILVRLYWDGVAGGQPADAGRVTPTDGVSHFRGVARQRPDLAHAHHAVLRHAAAPAAPAGPQMADPMKRRQRSTPLGIDQRNELRGRHAPAVLDLPRVRPLAVSHRAVSGAGLVRGHQAAWRAARRSSYLRAHAAAPGHRLPRRDAPLRRLCRNHPRQDAAVGRPVRHVAACACMARAPMPTAAGAAGAARCWCARTWATSTCAACCRTQQPSLKLTVLVHTRHAQAFNDMLASARSAQPD